MTVYFTITPPVGTSVNSALVHDFILQALWVDQIPVALEEGSTGIDVTELRGITKDEAIQHMSQFIAQNERFSGFTIHA